MILLFRYSKKNHSEIVYFDKKNLLDTFQRDDQISVWDKRKTAAEIYIWSDGNIKEKNRKTERENSQIERERFYWEYLNDNLIVWDEHMAWVSETAGTNLRRNLSSGQTLVLHPRFANLTFKENSLILIFCKTFESDCSLWMSKFYNFHFLSLYTMNN